MSDKNKSNGTGNGVPIIATSIPANLITPPPVPSQVITSAATAEEEADACELPGPARGGYRDDAFDEDVFAALTGDDGKGQAAKKKDEVQEVLPIPLRIRDRCMQLGYMIGPITEKEGKKGLEVGGFYMIEKDDTSFTLVDFIIPKGLPVTEGSITVAEHYPSTAAELKTINQRDGTHRRLSAMFHIHPWKGTGALHHSPADNDALSSLVNKMAETNKIVLASPYQLIEAKVRREYGAEGLVLKGDALSDAIVKFVYPNDQLFYKLLTDYGLLTVDAAANGNGFKKAEFLGKLLDIIQHDTLEPRIIRFATSFVFNNSKDKPFVMMEIEEKYALSGNTKAYTYKDPALEIIDKGVDIPTEEEVLALVKDRVKFPPKWEFFGKHFGKGKGRGRVFVGKGGVVFTPGDEGDTDDGVGAEYGPGNSYGGLGNVGSYAGSGKSYTYVPPAGKKVKKAESPGYSLEELSRQFALEATSYVLDFRRTSCKYSMYMTELLKKVSEFQSTYVYTGPGASSQAGKVTDKGDLAAHVVALGQLKQDPPKVDEPEFEAYKLRSVAENLADYHKNIDDKQARLFMLQFVNARDTPARNIVIEQYVTQVLKEHRKEREDDIASALEETGMSVVKKNTPPPGKYGKK